MSDNTFLCQHTVKGQVRCEGVGLHSGSKISMILKPAPPNHGIRFQRMDVCGRPTIAAHYDRVVDTRLATSIGFDGVVVSTVEHLMAALFGSCVDNVLVELDGPEVPVFDGSAAPYMEVIQRAGLQEQPALRQSLRVEEPILVREGDAYIKATPSDRFDVRYIIDFPHPLVGRQEFSWSFNAVTFGREVAKARTFGFLKDVERLQSMGLALGGSLANALVFDDRGLLNQDGFRYTNECVRHKVVDFLGDLALAGMPLIGHFEVYKAGHALHHQLLRQMAGKPGACTLTLPVCIPASAVAHTPFPAFVDAFVAKHV